ncbi:c-type cytochrome [Tropicibacter oceani]|uniref:Cytochrome c n=1 Tax=Tropicibacter oceani TaxID=3058420 RepID=A0ABY8QET7_9RHOB|nr:cytochrome c [Tropicibacter oceani]WGW02702.1 cytochrome c [Tropicibacter oceani]
MTNSIAGLTLAAAVLAAGAGYAQDPAHGETYYSQYCATCHGQSGKGDGPLTQMMTSVVPDLTQLSANNDGAFPMLEVIHIIDGRTGLRSHGGPMPVYGALFTEESGSDSAYGDVLYSRGKVLSIAYYLENIQE